MAETNATADDIAAVDPIKRFNNGTWSKGLGIEHWKYPMSVGSDTYQDDINFNSHETSEYAKNRMDNLSQMTKEPFMMFEFMKVDGTPNKNNTDYIAAGKKGFDWTVGAVKDGSIAALNKVGEFAGQNMEFLNQGTEVDVEQGFTEIKSYNTATQKAEGLIESLTTEVKRTYTGSICLYMPTGIEIGDGVTYNEDTRQFAAGVNEMVSGGGAGAFNNKAVLASQQAIGIYGGLASTLGGKSMLGALAGYGLGDIVSAEMQRSTGALLNKNEFAAYSGTPLRSFSFAWTILPDSEDESDQAAGLIKFFRESMHATKNDQVTITVPDHCIVSFHGSKDMIQLPPVVIENVGVTYNPNNSSFFRHNNAPVEIGLTIGLKEINPLYKDDIKAGY